MPTIQTAMTDANATSLANAPSDTTPFVRLKGVLRMTGLGRSTIYRLVSLNQFPRPVKLTARAVAWRRAELESWSADRPHTGR